MPRGAALVVAAALMTMSVSAQAAPAVPRVADEQLVAVLLDNHAARTRPDGGYLVMVNARRPLTGTATVLPVLARAVDRTGINWLRVRLPGRTLGMTSSPSTGWIMASHTQLRMTPWHLVVDLSRRRLTVYHDGQPVRVFSAIIGRSATPTPTGDYFVEEDVALVRGQPGGPVALATSARSAVLKEFDGGPGQVAIHGTQQLAGRLGTAASHGCIRLADPNAVWLAARVGAGAPVTIR
jgi:lipoprotein-anchoring transpeptidase ErfK/SrfK